MNMQFVLSRMKQSVLVVLFLLVGGGNSFASDPADPVDLTLGYDESLPGGPGHGKSSNTVPLIWLDDHQLTFEASHDDYTLELLDADGMVIYSTYVPSATTIVNLPAWLEGEYEIRLYGNTNYYFYGYIEL